MLLERLYRDVALALTSSNPDRELLNLEAVHGRSAAWFREHAAEEMRLLGIEAAGAMASDLADLADIEARNPSFDTDPVLAYRGFLEHNADTAGFRQWIGSSADPSAADLARFAARLPRQLGPRMGTNLRADQQGLIRAQPSDSPSIFEAWVDSSDCPLAVARGACQERGTAHVACRDSVNLSGCPHFAGVGVDTMVRCLAARVQAQSVQPPKMGDEMDVKEPDGSTSKLKVKRVDPDGSAVVEPTWKGSTAPV